MLKWEVRRLQQFRCKIKEQEPIQFHNAVRILENTYLTKISISLWESNTFYFEFKIYANTHTYFKQNTETLNNELRNVCGKYLIVINLVGCRKLQSCVVKYSMSVMR